MDDFNYNGLDKAWNKYISLSYGIDTKWKIPTEKVAYIFEPRTFNQVRRSDELLERMRIPELITFVSNVGIQKSFSVLNSIHTVSTLTQNYFDSTVRAYKIGVKENIIERVYYFYPWVRCFQTDTALEATFFTLVEYRNSRRVFKITKLVPDDLPDEFSVFQYLEEFWTQPAPTIHIESPVYQYAPPSEGPYNPQNKEICYNSIFKLFLRFNFGLSLNVSDAEIGLTGVGKLLTADDKKQKKVSKKLLEGSCYVSVMPSLFDNYFSYAYKEFLALSQMETYRDIFLAYKKLCNRSRMDERQSQAKQAYERFLEKSARTQGIRMDMSLEEFVRQKKKREILDMSMTLAAKMWNEKTSPE